MASAVVAQQSRSETADVLKGARLRDRLLELFDRVDRSAKWVFRFSPDVSHMCSIGNLEMFYPMNFFW